MLPQDNRNNNLHAGFTHLFLLMIVGLTAFITFAAITNRSRGDQPPFLAVLSDEDESSDNSGSGSDSSGSGSGSSSDDEVKVDYSDSSGKSDSDTDESSSTDDSDFAMMEARGGSNNEDDDEVEDEDEFEDEDENEMEDEDELEDQDEFEQEVEVEIEDGRMVLKLKYKDSNGNEFEEEREASGSGNLATLRVTVKGEETKVRIRFEDGMIALVQESDEGETAALTDLPINIDPENNRVTVRTESGEVDIDELPAGVLAKLRSSGDLDDLNKLELKVKTEEGQQKVYYHAKGENNTDFLGLFEVQAEVEAEVNAETGETEIVSEPWYLKYLGFLFF